LNKKIRFSGVVNVCVPQGPNIPTKLTTNLQLVVAKFLETHPEMAALAVGVCYDEHVTSISSMNDPFEIFEAI
jgi:hypothetical protein